MLLVVAVAAVVASVLGGPAGGGADGNPGPGLAAPQFLTSAQVGRRLIDRLDGPGLTGVVPAGYRAVPLGQGHTGPMTLAGESQGFAHPAQVRVVLTNDGFTGGYRRAWVLGSHGGPAQAQAIVASGYAFATPTGAADWMQVLELGASQQSPVPFPVSGLPHAVAYRVRESVTVHDEVVMFQVGRLTFQVVQSWPTAGQPTTEIQALARVQLARAGAG